MKNKSFLLFQTIFIFLSFIVALILFEIFIRYKLYNKVSLYVPKIYYTSELYDIESYNKEIHFGPFFGNIEGFYENRENIGPFKANQETELFIFSENDELVLNKKTRTNNYGFLSDKNYEFNDSKNNFNIIIIGDSMVGTTTMGFQWVDLVEDILVQKNKKIKVYNFGIPGQGFPHFKYSLKYFSEKINKIDLIVVNFITSTIPRKKQISTSKNKRIFLGYDLIKVDKELVKVMLYCTKKPINLSSNYCEIKNPIIANKKNILDSEFRAKLTEKINKLIRKEKILFNFSKFFFLDHFRYDDMNENWKVPIFSKFDESRRNEMFSQFKYSIQEIKKFSDNVILTLLPLFWEISPEFKNYKYYDKIFLEENVNIMSDHFKKLNFDDYSFLYNVPYDGHLSSEGGKIYAKMIADLIISNIK